MGIEDMHKWRKRGRKREQRLKESDSKYISRKQKVYIGSCHRVLVCCSMNPEIDVGQVEGAFVMGLGYFLMEKIEFDLETGELKTINT